MSRPMIERRHELGDLVAHRVRVAEHPRRVAHRGPRLDGGERDDLRDVVPAVALGRVLDHLAAVAGVEVHVDVGHLLAARVQEALEQQVVPDRVDVDDAEAVRDARARRAPPSRTDPDAARARVAHEVPHDEEVRREPHRLDDAELELDALEHLGTGRDRRSGPWRPRCTSSRRYESSSCPCGVGNDGQHRVAELDLDVGALGDRAACCRTPPRSRRRGRASPAAVFR